MEIKECYLNINGRSVNISTQSGEKPAIYCDPRMGAFVFNRVEENASELKQKKLDSIEGEVIQESEMSSRAIVFKRKQSSVELDISTYKDDFGVEVFYYYNDGDTKRMTHRGSGKVEVPDPTIKIANLESAVVRFDQIKDGTFGLNIEFSRVSINEEDQKESTENFDLIQDDSVSGLHEDKDPFSYSANKFEKLAEEISRCKTTDQAVNKVGTHTSRGNIIDKVKNSLRNTDELLDMREKLKDVKNGDKLFSSILTHRVREIVQEASSIEEFCWVLEASNSDIDPNMKLYEEPLPRKTIEEFKTELKKYQSEGEPVEVPPYCGLKDAVQINLANVSGSSTSKEDEDAFSGLSDEPNNSFSNEFDPSGEQVAATTPGAEEGLYEENDGESEYDETQRRVLEILVNSESIDVAINELGSIRNKSLTSGVIEGGYYYEVREIQDVLKAEKNKNQTGQFIQDLKGLQKLDDRFMPALRSLIVSCNLEKSEDVSDAKRNISNLQFRKEKLYSGATTDFSPNSIKLRQVEGVLDDINSIIEGSDGAVYDSIENAIQSLPTDGGIRRQARILSDRSKNRNDSGIF